MSLMCNNKISEIQKVNFQQWFTEPIPTQTCWINHATIDFCNQSCTILCNPTFLAQLFISSLIFTFYFNVAFFAENFVFIFLFPFFLLFLCCGRNCDHTCTLWAVKRREPPGNDLTSLPLSRRLSFHRPHSFARRKFWDGPPNCHVASMYCSPQHLSSETFNKESN